VTVANVVRASISTLPKWDERHSETRIDSSDGFAAVFLRHLPFKFCSQRLLVALLGLKLAFASSALAATILQPAGATTTMGSFSTSYAPINTINQSGMAATYVSGVTDFNSFVTSTPTSGGANGSNVWFSSSGLTTGFFDFNLGGTYTIQAFALWTDPQSAGQGVKTFNLVAANNPSFTSSTLLGSYIASTGPGVGNEAANVGQIFNFAAISASYVRMEVFSNYGSTSFTGISEAAFGVVSVSEPSTAVLLIAGLLVGVVVRRRNSSN
jgi:hypothetical protein